MRARGMNIMVVLLVTAAASACGGGGDPTPTGAPTSGVIAPPASPAGGCEPSAQQALVAAGLTFDRSCITVPAHEQTFLSLTNNDPGESHNVAIYRADACFVQAAREGDASTCSHPKEGLRYQGSVLAQGQTTYHILGLRVGKYTFICTVHPSMHGKFNVT
ncbi:MAG: plastocyanin/azurin family copper-binding protein [Actinomycetota bacterium]